MKHFIWQGHGTDQVAIYIRSAVGGKEADGKLARCKHHCLTSWDGHGPVFDDTGISGLDPERPSLALLLQQAAAGSIKVVVVHDRDAIEEVWVFIPTSRVD